MYKGEFLGFSFNGVHSSTLNIVRTSSGKGFSKELFPKQKDTTMGNMDRDGSLLLKSFFQDGSFNIKFAFDSLTATELRKLTKLFSSKDTVELIFDEEPYKAYYVKVKGSAKIDFVPFSSDDTDSDTIYKGTGAITLIGYYPFAKAKYQTISEYETGPGSGIDSNGVKVSTWKDASGILNSLSGYNTFAGLVATLYNPGDLDTPLKFVFDIATEGYVQLTYEIDDTPIQKIILDTTGLSGTFRLNTANRLLEKGTWDALEETFTPDGEVYNLSIVAGDFIEIQTGSGLHQLVLNDGNIITPVHIGYDYLYY